MQQLFQPFPWYNDPRLRNHYKEQCGEDCTFKLLTPQHHMLPFQIRRPKSPLPISGLTWACPDGTMLFTLNPDVFQIYTAGEWDYIVYDGRELEVCPDCAEDPFPCGWQVATMTDGVNVWYSELFWVEDDPAAFTPDSEFIWTDHTGEPVTLQSGEVLYVQ